MRYFFISLMVLLANGANAVISLEFVDNNDREYLYKRVNVKDGATFADAKEKLHHDILIPPSHIVLLANGRTYPDDTPFSAVMAQTKESVRLVFLKEHPEVKKVLKWQMDRLKQLDPASSAFFELQGAIERLKNKLYLKR